MFSLDSINPIHIYCLLKDFHLGLSVEILLCIGLFDCFKVKIHFIINISYTTHASDQSSLKKNESSDFFVWFRFVPAVLYIQVATQQTRRITSHLTCIWINQKWAFSCTIFLCFCVVCWVVAFAIDLSTWAVVASNEVFILLET